LQIDGTARAIARDETGTEGTMLSIHIDRIGELAVIECQGSFVRSQSASKLREAFDSQSEVRVIVLDLTEVPAIDDEGLGMLVFLQRWAHVRDIRLKVFNPHNPVRDSLEHVSSMREFDFATLDEIMVLLTGAGQRFARAA
jgi:anti-anti-sigma regulatory factor